MFKRLTALGWLCFHFKGHKHFHTLNPRLRGSAGTNSSCRWQWWEGRGPFPPTRHPGLLLSTAGAVPTINCVSSYYRTWGLRKFSWKHTFLPSKKVILSLMCAILWRFVLVNKTVTPHAILEILLFWCPKNVWYNLLLPVWVSLVESPGMGSALVHILCSLCCYVWSENNKGLLDMSFPLMYSFWRF